MTLSFPACTYTFMDWVHGGASDACILSELREGFLTVLDHSDPGKFTQDIVRETVHLQFVRGPFERMEAPYGDPILSNGGTRVRYRSVGVPWRDLFFLRRRDTPSLTGCLWLIRNQWPVGDDDLQDASVPPEEWVVRSVMES